MPRMISFSMTTPQFIAGTKDVTRRMGWLMLKPGDELVAVEKAMGLGKGGKVNRLGLIRVLDTRREKLSHIENYPKYGIYEVAREGFPDMTAAEFIHFFCEGHDCRPSSTITRIEFRKL
jgi:hypothetical protein